MSGTLQSYENTCDHYSRSQMEFKKKKDFYLKDENSIKEKQHGFLDIDEISQKENQTYQKILVS